MTAVALLAMAALSPVQSATSTFQEGVNGYTGNHDTAIRSVTPDRVDGALAAVNPDGEDGGGVNIGLIRFANIFGPGPNQIPLGATIHAVSLRLTLFDAGAPANIHRMLQTWDEATATWNSLNIPMPDDGGFPLDDVMAASTPDAPQFANPVGDLVLQLDPATLQAWSDGAANHGWALIPTGTDGWDFRSSEFSNESQRPLLTVIWGQPGEPFVKSLTPNLQGFTLMIEDGQGPGGKIVNPSSITVRLDGNPVNVEVTASVEATLAAIDAQTMWRYNNTGEDLGTAWREPAFNDSAWPQGAALLAFETGATAEPIRTELTRTGTDGTGIMTDYFRHRFTLPGPAADVTSLRLRHVIDDGAVFYINGQEVHRFSMPGGEVNFQTPATSHENSYEGPFELPLDALVNGENVIAVQVHQTDPGSSDVVFGAELVVSIADPQGSTKSVTYTAPAMFESDAQHTVELTFSDTATPAGTYQETITFNAPIYGTVPPGNKAPDNAVDRSAPGFNFRIHQMADARPGGNNLPAPLLQIRGQLIDPFTGAPYENDVDFFYFEEFELWEAGVFPVTDVINFDVRTRNDPTATIGNFRPDKPVPGIPGFGGTEFWFATEITTFLELPQGLLKMGVNSDDGFVVTTGLHPEDAFGVRLGLFDGGRGSADTIFDVWVPEAGIYPVTLYWWQGTGGGNVEWFTVDTETDTKILVNDLSNPKAIKAYRKAAFNLPWVRSISPAPGTGADSIRPNIEIVIVDAATTVQTGSVQLRVNGETVNPTTTKTGTETTVRYTPAADLPVSTRNVVQLTYGDSASPQNVIVREFTFSTADLMLIAVDATTMWRYNNTGEDLGTAWREPGFNDSSWPQGAALLAFETGATVAPIRTELTRTGTDGAGIMTDYFRLRFTLPVSISQVASLRLRHAIDDGAVFYLNGTEVHRFSMPAGEINFLTAAQSHENVWEGPFTLNLESLVDGENVIAVEVHQTDAGSSDVVFGAELIATLSTDTEPPNGGDISLSASKSATGDVVITFQGGTLQQADDVQGPYSDITTATSPHTVSPTAERKFYRVRQ